MDIHTVQQQLKVKSIYDIQLRVTFYARVSSERDEQLNSLGNQISYYENLIRQNAAWTFVEGYIDEGLSGMSTKKRENFHRMIEDAELGKFDLIITKEISRFARNTLDSIQYTRELLSHGVAVFFQNDNINTVDEDSELRLAIMSSIAQDELRKLSSRVKFGHQQAIRDGVVLGNSRIFGYQKREGKLVIDETEAPMVRELFELYATGQYSLKKLGALFWEKGYRNRNGKRLNHNTLSGILSNPKYKGYYVGNKVKIVDMFTKKQKFLPEEEWVMYRDEEGGTVPAIVSEDLWEQANEVLRRRSDDVKNRKGICNHPNLLTGKMVCAHCGAPYYRRDSVDRSGRKNNKWVCSGKIKNGAHSCPSIAIYESELKPILFEVFQETSASAQVLMEEYLALYRELHRHNDTANLIEEQRRVLKHIYQKRSKLLGYNASGAISDAEFLSMNKQCEEEIQAAEKKIQELESTQESASEFRRRLDRIRQVLSQAETEAATGTINKDFIDRYIDKILVTVEESGEIRLEIKIFTGESTEKYLSDFSRRVGHIMGSCSTPDRNPEIAMVSGDESRAGVMSKKMIEAYENGMQ